MSISQYQCQPREGHLSAVYHVFWYLKCNLKEISSRIVFDSKILNIDKQLFHPSDKMYGRSSIQTQKRHYLGILPLLGKIRYMSDFMWTPIMQAICSPGDLMQILLNLSIIAQSYGTVSARIQWSHQALATNP